jgi:hypothetical protein
MAFFNFLFKSFLFVVTVALFCVLLALGVGIWMAPKILPKFADSYLEGKTGFSLTVKKVKPHVFSGAAELDSLHINNPPYYKTKNFVHLSKAGVHLDLSSLLRDTAVVRYAEFNIDRISLVRNGTNNINAIEFVNAFRNTDNRYTPAPEPVQPVKSTRSGEVSRSSIFKKYELPERYLIQRLIVRLNELELVGITLSTDDDPGKTYAVKYEREFTNVSDVDTVINNVKQDLEQMGISIATKAIMERPVKHITDKVNDEVDRATGKVTKELERGAKKLFEAIKKL